MSSVVDDFDLADVDIDVADRDQILSRMLHVRARTTDPNRPLHPTGVYFQDIPVNPLDDLAVYDSHQAEKHGYFKFDFLNVTIYKEIESIEHRNHLLKQTPPWWVFEEPKLLKRHHIFHLHNKENAEICAEYAPKNIEEVAMVLAIIRPAKRNLIGKGFDQIAKTVWNMPQDESMQRSFMKKSHAIAYAHAIVLQLNRLVEKGALSLQREHHDQRFESLFVSLDEK